MCDNTIIADKVQVYVNAGVGFTSVDIANAIKIDGTWVRNRDVAQWLRNWLPPVGYGVTKTTVSLPGGNLVQASVYLPSTLSVGDYTTTAQVALTPVDFKALHGLDPFAPVLHGLDPDGAPATKPDPRVVTEPAVGHSPDGKKLGQKLKNLFNFRPAS